MFVELGEKGHFGLVGFVSVLVASFSYTQLEVSEFAVQALLLVLSVTDVKGDDIVLDLIVGSVHGRVVIEGSLDLLEDGGSSGEVNQNRRSF